MAEEKITKKEIKKKKKIWIKIIAPKEFNDVEIGESLVTDASDLLNRTVIANLMMLTGDMKKQNVKIKFIIKEVKEDTAIADIYGYQIVKSYARRIIGDIKSRIEDSFLCDTKDAVKLRIKPLVLTRYKTKGSILKIIRKNIKSILIDEIKKQDYKEIIDSLISYQLQKEMKNKLSKIYPISFFEIRILEKLGK